MNVIGRMSFQVPGGMIITGFMLQFYRTMPAVIFWQWVNQSFNALVNYTNRNAASPTSVRQMAVSYITATTTAVATAVGMNMLTKRAPPLVGRWVPFAAVAAANCVNIPMMRQQELIQGICVKDRNHNEIGHSRRAAAVGITQVVISRITMAAPGMILLPVIMERLEKLRFMKRIRVLHAPLQVLLSGCFLIFMVPVACGLFPQKCSAVTCCRSLCSEHRACNPGEDRSLAPGRMKSGLNRSKSNIRSLNCQFPIWNQSSKTPSRPSTENLCLLSTSIRVSECPTPARTSPYPHSAAPP
ncbi:sideroflexin-2 isoform X3 [Hippopotamus amphibius kiboko]|nr:sideroflexin-2 isoform X3 [Hippopotamus amphibius kiboko]